MGPAVPLGDGPAVGRAQRLGFTDTRVEVVRDDATLLGDQLGGPTSVGDDDGRSTRQRLKHGGPELLELRGVERRDRAAVQLGQLAL